jgi:hypothetical protein
VSFKLVYLSQQDPQWKADILGFGDPGDTVGYVGCALTSVSMLVSGHGYAETPKTLNEKLKSQQGFVSSGIRWDVVNKVHSQITLRENINCENTDAPLAKIDAALAAGQPVVVRVDSSPAAGLQWHYVLLYARKGNDYLMLDPWPYQPGTAKEDLLMARYSQGNPLQRSIQQILIYQCSTSGGTISTPASSGTTGTPPSTPAPASTPSSGAYARVKAELTWGLNIRSSADTSSMVNVVASVPAGTDLLLLDADGPSKIGTQQWVRVREPGGKEGLAAAWYLDKVGGSTPAPSTPVTEAPVSTPSSPGKIQVRVSNAVTSFLRIRSSADTSSDANVVTTVTAGTILTLVNAADESKIGKDGQWVRVRDPQGREGLTAAWYLEKVIVATKPVESAPAPTPEKEAPAPVPTTPATPSVETLTLKVSDAVGTSGLRMRKYPSLGGSLIMTLKAGTNLTVVGPADKAKAKIGKANQWIQVREPGGKRGYVSAEYVSLT